MQVMKSITSYTLEDVSEKQRKLTSDSGYSDDISDRRDSFSESLSNISFDEVTQNEFYDNLKKVTKNYEFLNVNEDETCAPSSIIQTCDTLLDVASVDTSKRKRRVTPVPKTVEGIKLSRQESTSKNSLYQILFVEEEDEEDIKKYFDEDDFICCDVATQKKISQKRNSWHGISDLDPIDAYKLRLTTLRKSKSLDRGKEQKDKRYRMNLHRTFSTDSKLGKKEKMTFLEVNTDTAIFPVKNQTTCYSSTALKNELNHDISVCSIKVSCDKDIHKETLPTWMRQAESENILSTCNDSNNESNTSLSTKLEIPDINWEKLNETKNKNNELLSNQRKMMMKQKNRAQRSAQSRRRKLTPSESPSHESLEKLSSLRNNGTEWIVQEEEEEEDEGDS